MPIYEYKCTTCEFGFEQRQGFDAESVTVCPRCQNQARRSVQAAPIIFKGSGFYVTDHGKRSSAISQSKPEEQEGSKENKANEKAEVATASKPSDGE